MSSSSTTSPAELVGLSLARACSRYAEEKQAGDVVVLDLQGLSQLCDYFVLCSGASLPQLKAIREEIVTKLSQEHGVRTYHRDGAAESQWMVLDFIDVVVHIFHKDLRKRYAIEDLWADAPQIDWHTGESMSRREPETEDA